MTENVDEVLIRILGYTVNQSYINDLWFCTPIDINRSMTLPLSLMTTADTKEEAMHKLLLVLEKHER